jgi:hypothetical protein
MKDQRTLAGTVEVAEEAIGLHTLFLWGTFLDVDEGRDGRLSKHGLSQSRMVATPFQRAFRDFQRPTDG